MCTMLLFHLSLALIALRWSHTQIVPHHRNFTDIKRHGKDLIHVRHVRKNVTSECKSPYCIHNANSEDDFSDHPNAAYDNMMFEQAIGLVDDDAPVFRNTRNPSSDCQRSATVLSEVLSNFSMTISMFQTAFLRKNEKEKWLQLSLKKIYSNLFDQPTNRYVQFHIERINSISTGQSPDFVSLTECYYRTQANVSSTTSACFRTQEFVLKNFESQYHMKGILTYLLKSQNLTEDQKKEINVTVLQLKTLETSQWQLVQSLCSSSLSYVFSAWNDEQPCSVRISHYQAECFNETQRSSLSLQLQLAAGSLELKCGENHHPGASNCDEQLPPVHPRLSWYISTKVLSACNIYRENICRVSFKTRALRNNHHLLFLEVNVCNNTGHIIRNVNGFTKEKGFIHRARFPLYFNPGAVGNTHTKPFFITGVGLYLDYKGRISVKITTSKPLGNLSCSTSTVELLETHKLSYP